MGMLGWNISFNLDWREGVLLETFKDVLPAPLFAPYKENMCKIQEMQSVYK